MGSEDMKTRRELLGDLILQALSGERGIDQRIICETGLDVTQLLLKKNADYGSSAWKSPLLAPECGADAGMRVRMSDKIERLIGLLKGRAPDVADEPIEETVKDLIGYLVLWLAFLRHEREVESG